MPAVVAWILGGLAWALASAFGRIMTALGLAFVVNAFVMEPFVDTLQSQLGGLPSFAAGMLGWFKIDVAATIILSALAVNAVSGRITGLAKRGAAAGVV